MIIKNKLKHMKTVTILVPESSVMEAIADPRYMFTAANQFLQSSGRPPLFDVQLVGGIVLHPPVIGLNEAAHLAVVQQ